eukprot:c26484_g1_i2 orf=45-2201(+)
MLFTGRPSRQQDYHLIPSSRSIVIDNGAFFCRVGWAGESSPRLLFRNALHRPRLKLSGELVNIVGDYDPALAKFFDFTRSSYRSAFDGNVVYQFETMECILDYAFDQMGVDNMQVGHPILLTECPCNPLYSRSKMAELLFETYSIPSIAFGVDGIFSYNYNQRLGICEADGLAICSGYTTTHAIPIINGEPILEACCRTNVGGFQVTDYLKRLLSLQYPHHIGSLSWEKVEELKVEHSYVAQDFASELRSFQEGAAEKISCWQLPWIPPPPEEQASEEELARKAAIKEKQSQRLREMAAAKRSFKIADLEIEIQGLEQLLCGLDNSINEQNNYLLMEAGYTSRQDVEAAISKASLALRKAKGEPVKIEKESEKESEALISEKYPLLDIPNEMLTVEQLKEKKKQLFLKSTSEGRARAKQRRHEEELQRGREHQLEEERRLLNPEQYLQDLRGRQAELAAKVEQRKKQKRSSASSFSIVSSLASTTSGRSERLNAAQKERMKLLTTAAFDRGKDEDTFGMRDEDWQLYKRMGKDNDEDSEPDEDELELARLNGRLQELDPLFNPSVFQQTADARQNRSLTAEDFQILLGTERFRCPEILFQPHIIGIDQAGLNEMIGISMRRLAKGWVEQVARGTILLTGGNTLYNGLDARLHAELRKNRPEGSDLKILKASDPLLDAWRGASTYAASPLSGDFFFTKIDYEERGEDWLRKYTLKYSGC